MVQYVLMLGMTVYKAGQLALHLTEHSRNWRSSESSAELNLAKVFFTNYNFQGSHSVGLYDNTAYIQHDAESFCMTVDHIGEYRFVTVFFTCFR